MSLVLLDPEKSQRKRVGGGGDVGGGGGGGGERCTSKSREGKDTKNKQTNGISARVQNETKIKHAKR